MAHQQVGFMYAPTASVAQFTPVFQEQIQQAFDANFLGGDAAEAIDSILSEDAGMLTVWLEGETEPIAFCCLDTMPTNEGDYLRVVSLTGTRMDRWLDELVLVLRQAAEINNTRGVMFMGRKGWRKKLKKYGFTPVQDILRMTV